MDNDTISCLAAAAVVAIIVLLVVLRPREYAETSVTQKEPAAQNPREGPSFDQIEKHAEQERAQSFLKESREEDPYEDQSIWQMTGETGSPTGLVRTSRTLLGNVSRVRQSEMGLAQAFDDL